MVAEDEFAALAYAPARERLPATGTFEGATAANGGGLCEAASCVEGNSDKNGVAAAAAAAAEADVNLKDASSGTAPRGNPRVTGMAAVAREVAREGA